MFPGPWSGQCHGIEEERLQSRWPRLNLISHQQMACLWCCDLTCSSL